MKTKLLIAILLLGWLCSGIAYAQTPDTLFISTTQVVHLRFGSELKYVNLGNKAIVAKIVDGAKDFVAVKAREAFDRYGVDGIMVARATYGRPWIFRDIRHYLDTGELLPEPSVREKVAIARRHLRLSLDLKGEPRGVYEMRRHLSCYFRGLPDFKETRIRMVTTLDVPELFSILDEIEERYADL